MNSARLSVCLTGDRVMVQLTKKDAEERSRPLHGAVLDAAEEASIRGQVYRESLASDQDSTVQDRYARIGAAAESYIAALNRLVNRQSEVIADQNEVIRQGVA